MDNSGSQQKVIGIVSRSDVVRAIRQCIADQGIDLVSIVRDAATGAVEKKLQNLDISPMLREHVVDQVKAGMWEIRNSVANQIASRFTLKDLP